ncbi:hypothetical protein Syun_011100 [Stephania yunnanensis]|uniref:Uncharacterized protein n=1 Tax=Stephania yunnanensis TaxID=152371 RepID=A0AAP0PHW3_9MAGN
MHQSCTNSKPPLIQSLYFAIKLLSCNKTSVRDVKFVDSPQAHLLAFGCEGVCVNNVSIRSPGDSPNTDGIHLQSARHVGKGYARGITFKQLRFTNVENPIIIDQNYCDVAGQCEILKTGVHISNVSYEEAYGTSSTVLAISLNCSQAVPCTDIMFNSVILGPDKSGAQVIANCANVQGSVKGRAFLKAWNNSCGANTGVPIMIHGNSSTIFFASPQNGVIERNESWRIRAYARKVDIAAMKSVTEFLVKSLATHSEAPNCTKNYNVTAIVFSAAGYSYNHFHSFGDSLPPISFKEKFGSLLLIQTLIGHQSIKKYYESSLDMRSLTWTVMTGSTAFQA